MSKDKTDWCELEYWSSSKDTHSVNQLMMQAAHTTALQDNSTGWEKTFRQLRWWVSEVSVEGVIIVMGAIDFICCISTTEQVFFGRPWCLCTFCDFLLWPHSCSIQMKFCTHLQITVLPKVWGGGLHWRGYRRALCYSANCSSLPTCTAVVSGYSLCLECLTILAEVLGMYRLAVFTHREWSSSPTSYTVALYHYCKAFHHTPCSWLW